MHSQTPSCRPEEAGGGRVMLDLRFLKKRRATTFDGNLYLFAQRNGP